MKVEKISQVAILVKDLEKASKFFADLLETEFTKLGEFEEWDANSLISPLRVELIEPLTTDGPTSKVIERRGEGLSFLSLKVTNIEEAVAEMKSRGIRLIRRVERSSFRGATFHPKDTYGVMIELLEYKAKHPLITATTE